MAASAQVSRSLQAFLPLVGARIRVEFTIQRVLAAKRENERGAHRALVLQQVGKPPAGYSWPDTNTFRKRAVPLPAPNRIRRHVVALCNLLHGQRGCIRVSFGGHGLYHFSGVKDITVLIGRCSKSVADNCNAAQKKMESGKSGHREEREGRA